MKTSHLRFLSLSVAFLAAFGGIAQAADSGSDAGSPATGNSGDNGKSNAKNDKKPKTIFLLDGSSLFGKIEVTDDYTLKVSSDSGIQKIPLALLGEPDFKKYGFSKDRSQDGRFWSDRQGAVSDQQKKDDSKDDKSKGDNSQLEISLAEILPFQPLIASFQKSNPAKKDDKSSESDDQKDKSSSGGQLPFVPLFSQPGMSSLPTSPMGGLSTGGLPSAPGASLLPAPPGVPGLPTGP